jgi:hypothetical protein
MLAPGFVDRLYAADRRRAPISGILTKGDPLSSIFNGLSIIASQF